MFFYMHAFGGGIFVGKNSIFAYFRMDKGRCFSVPELGGYPHYRNYAWEDRRERAISNY